MPWRWVVLVTFWAALAVSCASDLEPATGETPTDQRSQPQPSREDTTTIDEQVSLEGVPLVALRSVDSGSSGTSASTTAAFTGTVGLFDSCLVLTAPGTGRWPLLMPPGSSVVGRSVVFSDGETLQLGAWEIVGEAIPLATAMDRTDIDLGKDCPSLESLISVRGDADCCSRLFPPVGDRTVLVEQLESRLPIEGRVQRAAVVRASRAPVGGLFRLELSDKMTLSGLVTSKETVRVSEDQVADTTSLDGGAVLEIGELVFDCHSTVTFIDDFLRFLVSCGTIGLDGWSEGPNDDVQFSIGDFRLLRPH